MDNNIVDKRTKGEWKQNHTLIFADGRNKAIVDALQDFTQNESFEEAKANAAFICKAVNNYDSLLEALKEVYNMLVHEEGDLKGNKAKTDIFKYCPKIGELYCKVRQVIQKAEQ